MGKVPTSLLQRRIRARSSDYTITRVTESVNDIGEVETTKSTHTATLWCFSPRNVTEQLVSGEHTGGQLQGLMDPSEDVTFDDRLTHGDSDYEVADVTVYPDETQPVYHALTLDKRDGP